MRGCAEEAGRQVNVARPWPRLRWVCQTTVVPVLPARTMFVATTSIRTLAALVSLKCTYATSRKPSPFGLTVVSRRWSPAYGVEPFVTLTSMSCAGGPASAATAARNSVITLSTRP